MGQLGFTIMSIAALLSTFSAINATVYGGSRVSYELAEDDELPHGFTFQFWNKPIGLIVTTAFTLLIANFMDLESISTSGSSGFLLIFAAVNFIAYRKSDTVKSSRLITFVGAIFCGAAFAILVGQQFMDNPSGIWISLGIIIVCFVFEYFYKQHKRE